MAKEHQAKNLQEIASYFKILANDQIGCIRFQQTKKAKDECKLKAEIYNDCANILENTELTG